jgi:hypothetical protein
MAQLVTTALVDDLDGAEAAESVAFALDGAEYEIDLSEANAAKLRDALGGYVSRARRTGGRLKRGLGNGTPDLANREQNQAIREWAQKQGHPVSDRGRIPSAIQEAFHTAHAVPAETPKRTRKATAKRTPSLPAFAAAGKRA